jgi:CRISPR-associated endonuclease/helicase Cas3
MDFKEIYKKDNFYNDFYKKIENKDFLSGHRIKEDNETKFESLKEHLDRVILFFLKYVKNNNLSKIFENMIPNLNQEEKTFFITSILRIIFLHDIGKLYSNTQKYFKGKKTIKGYKGHGETGLIVNLLIFYENIKNLDKSLLRRKKRKGFDNYDEINFYVFMFIYGAKLHHGNLNKITSFKKINDEIKRILNNSEIRKATEEILDIFFPELKDKLIELEKIEFTNVCEIENGFFENLFYDLKCFYSCLVQSDYLATYSYQFKKELKDIKIEKLDNILIEEMEINYYKAFKENFKLEFQNLEFINLDNKKIKLNDLRNNLLIESNKRIGIGLKNNKKIFMLEVPTGGGKTNISLSLIFKILKYDKNICRVFFVFPFVNIIEQNYNIIKKFLFSDKENENLSQIYYSHISFYEDYKYYNNEEIKEEEISRLLEMNLNMDFLNSKFCVISSINFFNSLFKNKKNNRYKFSNLANSIIIIDEIQSIKLEYLDFFYEIIIILSKKYNIYFIIMSATLPNIKNELSYNLIEKSENYFKHKIFLRNEIIFENEKKIQNEEELYDYINLKIKSYKPKKLLIVLNTISSSIKFYEFLRSKIRKENYEIFLLNSTIISKQKKKIIEYIKKSNTPIILVSTQSIEAGVDLDFDMGIRDMSIIDSIEQIGGRVNRECKKYNSKLFIINYKNNSQIYKEDIREKIKNDEKINIDNILKDKSFDFFYSKIFKKIKKDKSMAILDNYSNYLKEFQFENINNEINLIENKPTLNILIENINVEKDEKMKFFLENELKLKELKTTNLVQKYLDLQKKEKNNFKLKPFETLFNKILINNSINITFWSNELLEKFKQGLLNKNLIEEKNNFLFISNQNYEKYLDKNGNNFKYFNIEKLKKEINEYLKLGKADFF